LCRLADARDDVLALVVDDDIGTGGRRGLGLGRTADRGEHLPRAEQPSALHRGVPHRSGTAGDQHPLAGHAAARQHRMHGRQPGNAQACAGLVRHAVGQRHRLRRRQHDMLRRRAERAAPSGIPDPYALADAIARDTIADGVDHAHAVAVRDHARERHAGPAASARLGVRRIHAGPVQPHAHLAGIGHRVRNVAELQNLRGRAVAFVEGSLHANSSCDVAAILSPPRGMDAQNLTHWLRAAAAD